jgi:hypothetical protein
VREEIAQLNEHRITDVVTGDDEEVRLVIGEVECWTGGCLVIAIIRGVCVCVCVATT